MALGEDLGERMRQFSRLHWGEQVNNLEVIAPET